MLVQSWKNLVGQWLNRFESIRGLRTGGRRRRPGHLAQTRFAPWLENLETRVLLAGDSFESNETWQTASDLGVIPGVHRGALSIDVVGDHDWYTFELLRPDDLAFQIDFNATAGNLSFELVQVSAGTPTTLQSSIANTTGAGVQAVGLAPGRYYLHVFGGGNTNTYSVAVDPASTSSTRVLYVNDGLTTNDYYTLAAGSTTNSGLSPLSPKASIQQLLDNYTLGPQDLVVVDTGTYSGAVLATSGDEGVIYAGSPGTSRLNATFELADSDYNTLYRLTLAGPTKALYIRGTTVDPTTNTTVQSVRVLASTTGIQIDGGRDQLIADTVIEGAGSYGLSVSNAGAVTLLRSTISQRNYGAYFYYTSPVVIDSSDISALTYGVYSYGGADLIVTNTALHHAQYGLYRTGGAVLATGNRIYSNQVGAQSESDASASVFSGNEVYLNTTGLSGYGRFGGTSWEPGEPNDIYGNVTGLKPSFGQPVQFNRIRDNTVGVQQSGVRPSGSTVTSSIHHNLLWNNSTGILVSGGTHAALVNNTVVTASGTGVRLQQGASQVALRNNIFSTTGGYGLSVATDSQFGFSSDYNNHHASGSGQPVWWQKPFADLYDWQVEADYDRHSLGYTVIDPNRDDPRFANPAAGDFRLLSNSTSIDAGDPSDVFTAEPGPNGPRIDLGAYGNTPLATPSAARSLRLEYPEFYADWPIAEGRSILWRTYDSDTADKRLSGLVSIDLYTSTGTVVAHIATVPASDESYGWSPEASGLTGSLTSRYRIQISSVSDPSLADSSREEFAVPPDGAFYYVNDSSIIGDEWTAVAGNNRATGKSAGDPKANLLPVLRAYDLGPGDQVRIDTGSYIHVRNVVLSGNITLGNDEGMTITGPTNPAALAQLNRANTASWATNIELNDADYVTLRNLSLTGAGTGLWVRNGSTNFRGDRLTSLNNSSHGFLLESDAVASQVDFLTAGGNGGDGIRILTSVDSVSNSLAYNNTGTGIFISHSGATTAVEANRVYGNRVGIDASGNVVVGNANLATGRGNLVSGNSSDGIRASGSLVVGNTVWGHTGSGAAGILLTNSAPARDNVVHGNSYGIRGSQSSTEITRNRVFNNSLVGIRALHASVIQGNVVYANPIGLEAVVENTWFSGTISNNLIYANPSMAIRLEGKGARITGNTIYQPSGDGLVVEGSSTSATVRNNVFSLAAGAALSVASNSQVGFQSDSNLFHITGTGKVAFWQGAARTTLSAWYNTVFQDENSLASDPLFVSPAGPDGILGYSATATTDFGSDDDFHEQSDYGSFHGGSLAPIRDTVTGLPVTAPGAWINDALRSPTIDRGRAGDPYVNEPSGNGGYLNLGAYGNTPQASKSPAEYVLVTRPDGGEVWPARQTFPIRWRSHDNLGNVHIELWQTGGTTAVSRIATDTPNDGEFLWQIPTTITTGTDYRIRVIRTDNQALLDQSNSNFEITPPITVYYVNDGSTVGDEYSLAVGDNANTGLSPNAPKATLAAVLAAYDLGPGDVIRIDTGTYNLAGNVAVAADDSGVRIEGPQAGTATLNRGNTATGSYVIELAGADDVTLSRLTLTGGQFAVFGSSSADSDRFTLENSILTGNSLGGVSLASSNDQPVLSQNRVVGGSQNAILTQGTDALIVGNEVSGSGSAGMFVSGVRSRIQGNEVYNATTGLDLSGSSTSSLNDRIEVTGNLVHHNSSTGISAYYGTLVSGNTVWGQTSSSGRGIYIIYGATAQENEVFDNTVGIELYDSGTVQANRVYRNTSTGIRLARGGSVIGNTVYSNSVGIDVTDYYQSGARNVTNNLVYANTNQGIRVGISNTQVINNTVYQPVGNAVLVENSVSNITLRNNILWVDAGANISVNSNSQVGFSSDYNTLRTSGTGVLGRWENLDFTTLADWRYEVGHDEHSLVSDPDWIDRDGPDNLLGFSATPVAGSTRILDNGDPGFTLTGTWTSSSSGYQADSAEAATVSSSGDKLATWTFTGLDPDAWYEVSVTWPARSALSYASQFSVREGQALIQTVSLDQRSAPNDFTENGTAWERLGTYYLRGDTLTVQLPNGSPSGWVVSADAVRVQKLLGDRAADDNFQATTTSPTIDAGDPTSVYATEPTPNGRRVNQGYTGNTAQATSSPVQMLQVLNPSALDKYEVGQPVSVRWQAAGLTQTQPTLLINAGGGGVGNWLANLYQPSGSSTSSFTNSIDLSAVTDPAPTAVYQTYTQNSSSSIGSRIAWQLPVANGNYTIRLHFAEPSTTTVGNRKFDIQLQGTTVRTDYDIYATAGARYKATTLSYPVTATGGTGIALDLVNKTAASALLCGIEILSPNTGGTASLTADLEFSSDSGSTWSSVATGVAIDRYGAGAFTWTPTVETSQGLLRVRANHGTQPVGVSSGLFQISNAGTHYYINDAATTGDLLTTAVGNNANTGKSPAEPMASLAALVAAYDLDAGDIIHVETGDYRLVRNVVLGASDSGVQIEGPRIGTATLNRGNTATGSYVIELAGADDVTLSRLTLTGGQFAVFGSSSADSDRFTLENSTLTGNSLGGVSLASSNDQPVLSQNRVVGGSQNGILTQGTDALIVGNEVSGSGSAGMFVSGVRSRIQGNEVYNATTGLDLSGSSTSSLNDRIEVTGNLVHHNSSTGISAYYGTLVSGNTVWGQTSSSGRGIYIIYGATAQENEVFDNTVGIELYDSGTVQANRVYRNTSTGIRLARGGSVIGNTVYSNSVGIDVTDYYQSGARNVTNNLVYANTNQGIRVAISNTQVVNNTVYQPVGNAVLVENSVSNITLRNNILWVDAGANISVNSNSQVGFSSDYNTLRTSGTGVLGRWENLDFTTLADWRYEVGHDEHSLVSDPDWIDRDGPDNLLGFSATPVAGSTRILDNGDPGFTLTGTWTSSSSGYQADSAEAATVSSSGDKLATWTFTGLDPDAWYEVSVTWPARSALSYASQFSVREGQALIQTVSLDQRSAPNDFTENGTAWERLGTYYLRGDTLTVQLPNGSPSGWVVSADAVRVQKLLGDRAADDNFQATTTSPTIDAGDPTSVYATEPTPNGRRVNQGYTGNTAQATSSPVQMLQVLNPSALDKYEVGQPVSVRWQAAGLTQVQPALLVNAGGTAVGGWLANSYRPDPTPVRSPTPWTCPALPIPPPPPSIRPTLTTVPTPSVLGLDGSSPSPTVTTPSGSTSPSPRPQRSATASSISSCREPLSGPITTSTPLPGPATRRPHSAIPSPPREGPALPSTWSTRPRPSHSCAASRS